MTTITVDQEGLERLLRNALHRFDAGGPVYAITPQSIPNMAAYMIEGAREAAPAVAADPMPGYRPVYIGKVVATHDEGYLTVAPADPEAEVAVNTAVYVKRHPDVVDQDEADRNREAEVAEAEGGS